jgi:GNAT superfamily N-acetyltransferase
MRLNDIEKLYKLFILQGWHRSPDLFKDYYDEQIIKKRIIKILEINQQIIGYGTLILNPNSGPWKNKAAPLISDLIVFQPYQQKGHATRLMKALEKEAFKINDIITLAVGVHQGYGAAQRLYVKLNYQFDGSGVWYKDQMLKPYEKTINDDELLLYMYKKKDTL